MAGGSGDGGGTAARTRVLVVDDHAIGRLVVSTLLDRFGMEAVAVASAAEALEAAAGGRFDIALLDLGLPDMAGIELAAALAAGPGLCGAPIVALTGQARPDHLPAPLAAWLEKPIGVRDLHATIAAALGRPFAAAG